jgi:hypothetical protein
VLYEAPTVGALAEYVAAGRGETAAPADADEDRRGRRAALHRLRKKARETVS